MPGIPARVLSAPHLAGDPDGHRGGAPPALLASTLLGEHQGVAIDHPPEPCPVPALTRGAAAGASAPGGPPTAPGAIPARHEGGVDGGPQPPTGPPLHNAAGTAVDHPGDDPQARARPPRRPSADPSAAAPRAPRAAWCLPSTSPDARSTLAHTPGRATARGACPGRSTRGGRGGVSPAGPDGGSSDGDTRLGSRDDPLAGTVEQAWTRPPDGHRDRCCPLPVSFQRSRRYFPPRPPIFLT
jgi:hypothetical protein